MSWQAVDWVMRHSPTEGTERLVTLALAEQSRDEAPGEAGAWLAYPGVKRIAHYAGLRNERTAQAALKRMLEKGLLLRGPGPEFIRADRRPNLYGIPTNNGVQCGFDNCVACMYYGVRPESPRKPLRGALRVDTGCATDAHGVTVSASRGAPGVTRTVVSPSLEPSEPSPVRDEKSKTASNTAPRQDIDAVAAHYYAAYGHLGATAVSLRMEQAGYDDIDVTAALDFMEKSWKTA